jgi:REP element-mobilizing transposase RayT
MTNNKYNPRIHNRRSIRLKGYDYSQSGLYFITICCHNRIHRFGDIQHGTMVFNEFGQIAYDEWGNLTNRFSTFALDVFQIMPNHMHGIISLTNPVRAGFTSAPPDANPKGQPQRVAATISDIVGAYKSLVANGCLKIYKSNNETMGKLWQRNYYEHIIRDEKAYRNIINYIRDNPKNWKGDTFY